MFKIDSPINLNSYNDHFNLYPKANGIINFLQSPKAQNALMENNLIALYGEWGSGKSSIVKTVKAELNKNQFKSVMFESWKYEKDDNLTFSIFEAIADSIIEDKKAVKKIMKEEVWGAFKSFKNGLTFKSPMVDINLGEMKMSPLEESLYTKIETFLNEFKNLLTKYSNNKKIVVFIDDLDRCEDENIINLLISLKLMFALEGIIFICCVDKTAIIEVLKGKYNNNREKAESFLDKLFLFDFNIVHNCKKYGIERYIDIEHKDILISVLEALDIKNPRKIKKIENKIKMLTLALNTELKDESDFYIYVIYFIIALKEFDYSKFLKIFTQNGYNQFSSIKNSTMISGSIEYESKKPIEEPINSFIKGYRNCRIFKSIKLEYSIQVINKALKILDECL